MVDVSDLLPSASGSASIGVEQNGVCGMTTDIRPFCHIHQNSGVFHDPFYGNSGVLRYTKFPENGTFEGISNLPPAGFGFEMSRDGGRSFFPVSLSGVQGNIRSVSVFTAGAFDSASLGPDIRWNFSDGPNVSQGPDGTFTITFGGFSFLTIDNASLSGIYEEGTQFNGNLIRAVEGFGDVIWESETAKGAVFASSGEYAATNFSGVLDTPDMDLQPGDLTAVVHGLVDSNKGITSIAEAQARSLGLYTMSFNTGSGTLGFMVPSGIQRFTTGGLQSLSTFPTYTQITTHTLNFQPDQHMAADASNTGVRVFVPGLYMLLGVIACTATTIKTILSQVQVNGVAQTAFGDAVVCNTNEFATLKLIGYLNLQAGDRVSIAAAKVGGAGTVLTLAGESALNLHYIGPKRG